MTVFVRQLVLTEAEWAVMHDLLARERHDLPIEINHTTARKYREELRKRLRLVEQMLERFEATAVVA